MAEKQPTTKFKVDISELKKSMQEAQRQIRLANSEFKMATAGMDNWSASADGISAKITQLNSIIDAEKKKLESLEAQYRLVVEAEGETSKGAEELLIKINNQKASLGKAEASLSKFNSKLSEMENESENAGDSLDKMKKSSKKAEEGFTVMKGAIANLIADGLKALAQNAVESMRTLVTETQNAHASFQAQTGASTEEMVKFEKEMNAIYRSGMGESIQDVANAMSEVKQQTKETDPTKLKELTANAIALRDTFDMDVKESMRAVNMLMEQFGITGTEAYNLIVQGAQKGLNKNGDLLDTINEYGVHYQQLGYDADDFFNSLSNGTEAGTFSVDKLGDAMKEFGIRTKDTAETTSEGFELVGLDADKMREAFSKGGESAQKATQKTLKALLGMDDKVKQNQAGVDLFGTMWEDLGIEGVKALTNTNGELTKTKKSMDEVKKVKYDTVSTEFTKMGRTLQQDFFLPLAEKTLPTVEKFIDYLTNNMDEVATTIKVVGGVMGTVFVVNKIATFTQSITTMVTTFKTLKTATEGATTAQKMLNLVQNANPIMLVVGAVGLLTGGLIAYTNASKKSTVATDEEIKKINEFNGEIAEQTKAYEEVKKAREESVNQTESEFGYYSSLSDELDKITDKNGKVKKGYEDRADAIAGVLSEALDEEIKKEDLVAEGKQKTIDKINELISAKKNEALLSTYEQSYTDALKNEKQAYDDLTKAKQNVQTITEKINVAKQEEQRWEQAMQNTWDKGSPVYQSYQTNLINAKIKTEELSEEQKKANETLNKAQNKFLDYQNVIANYEGVSSAIVQGDTKKINEAMNLLVNNFARAENSTKEILEAQVKNAKDNLKNIEKAFKDGEPGVTQQMVDNAKKLVTASEKELNKLTPKADASGKKAGEEFAGGMGEKKERAKRQGKIVSDKAKEGLESADTKKSGEKEGENFVKGVSSKKEKAKTSGKEVSKKAKDGLEETKTKTSGTNFVQGFIDGINGKTVNGSLFTAITNLGGKAIKWLNDKLDEHSPSRITYKTGEYFTEGFRRGIESGVNSVAKSVEKLGEVSSKQLADSFNIGEMTNEIAGKKTTTTNLRQRLIGTRIVSNDFGASVSSGKVTNVYNFNQTNNSPKSLNRWEIYRQSKNLLRGVLDV